jgi:glycine/D-amino acid oxidase-like deaminating enzyme
MPAWLDGETGPISALGMGDDTAQITPTEFVCKMLERHQDRIRVVLGTCTGVETEEVAGDDDNDGEATRRVTAVNYVDQGTGAERRLPCDAFVVSNGPWACQAEDWLGGRVQLPMEGVKSTSIVWEPPSDGSSVDATALFCGEDSRYGTHLEVYPRPDGTVYLCGIGGSDYVPRDALKRGAFRDECPPKDSRVEAAQAAFTAMSYRYRDSGKLAVTQACMRPCPPDALPYMGRIPGHVGAYINAGHNCWCVAKKSSVYCIPKSVFPARVILTLLCPSCRFSFALLHTTRGIAWAPAAGKAMAELILEGRATCLDLSPFDPGRYTPSAAQRGNRGRKQRGLNVGEQW